jgi:hypothetical protein
LIWILIEILKKDTIRIYNDKKKQKKKNNQIFFFKNK